MTISNADTLTVRPEANTPSWGWALRRAVFGLVIMIAVTSLAALIANASIENPVDTAPSNSASAEISIGAPAAAMLRH